MRSSTVWSKSVVEQWKGNSDPGRAVWPEEEVAYLYVKDPSRAQLALTVFDEEARACTPTARAAHAPIARGGGCPEAAALVSRTEHL